MALRSHLAEVTYKLSEPMKILLLMRVTRPFKARLYLICFNNKCFDFKPMLYILILIILNVRTSEGGTAEPVNEINSIF